MRYRSVTAFGQRRYVETDKFFLAPPQTRAAEGQPVLKLQKSFQDLGLERLGRDDVRPVVMGPHPVIVKLFDRWVILRRQRFDPCHRHLFPSKQLTSGFQPRPGCAEYQWTLSMRSSHRLVLDRYREPSQPQSASRLQAHLPASESGFSDV